LKPPYRPGRLALDIETDYPATGKIRITVAAAPSDTAEISFRVPAWADGAKLNDGVTTRKVPVGSNNIVRVFAPGDRLELILPVEPRLSWPDARIDAVRGCVAVERGPEVYALESVDLPEGWNLDEAQVDAKAGLRFADAGKVSIALRRQVFEVNRWPTTTGRQEQPSASETAHASLVPYHSWAERGPSTMRIWIPVSEN
jgi:DUF1680 family protein